MKVFLQILLCVLFISCSESDNNIETIQKTNESIFSFKSELEKLEKGLNDLIKTETTAKNGKMIVGYVNNGVFTFRNNGMRRVTELTFKRNLLKEGYLTDCTTFDIVSDREDKGLLRSKGECSISFEHVYHAIDLDTEIDVNDSNRLMVYFGLGSSVTCNGCRRGCNPRKDSNGDGYCTECKIANSSCSKSETLN